MYELEDRAADSSIMVNGWLYSISIAVVKSSCLFSSVRRIWLKAFELFSLLDIHAKELASLFAISIGDVKLLLLESFRKDMERGGRPLICLSF